MSTKKTPNRPAKKARKTPDEKMPEMKASVSFHGCHLETHGPGPEALTAISDIARALDRNARALDRLAGFANAPGIVIEAPD